MPKNEETTKFLQLPVYQTVNTARQTGIDLVEEYFQKNA